MTNVNRAGERAAVLAFAVSGLVASLLLVAGAPPEAVLAVGPAAFGATLCMGCYALERRVSLGQPVLSVTALVWVAAVLGGVGDVVTTWYGLRAGLTESNPVVIQALEVGGFGLFVLLKLFVLSVAVVAVRVVSPGLRWVPPLILALVWGFAGLINLSVIHG